MLLLILLFFSINILTQQKHIINTEPNKTVQLSLIQIKKFYYIEIMIGNKNKLTRLKINSDSKQIKVECAQASNIFYQIYNFLRNPFHQNYNYQCKSNQADSTKDSFNLPILGNLDINFLQLKNRKNYGGELGLSKTSEFLNSLPVIYKKFSIYINTNSYNGNLKSSLILGGYNTNMVQGTPDKIPIINDSDHWIISIQNLFIYNLTIQGGNAIINSGYQKIKMPSNQFQLFTNPFKKNLGCIYAKDIFMCPCETGQLSKFPPITINLKNANVKIYPEAYINIEEQKCQILIEKSLNQLWILGLPFFRDNIVYFENQSVSVARAGQFRSDRKNLKSPFQIILNTSVILILCLFISLILIELIRRLSGYADAKQQTIHQIILRDNHQE